MSLTKPKSIVARFAFAVTTLVLQGFASGCADKVSNDVPSSEKVAPSLRDNLEKTTNAGDENANVATAEAAKV